MSEEIKRKLVFNENGDRGTSRIINGNSTNLIEWNRIKYAWASKLRKVMNGNIWFPEKTPLGEDVKTYATLTEPYKRAFNLTISFLNFLDSIQTENIPNIRDYVTAPEVSSCLTIQAFQEDIHAQSYSYILDSIITDPSVVYGIYDMWRNDEHLLTRNRFIATNYQQFVDNPTERTFLISIFTNYILESLFFYNGFAFFHALARQNLMVKTDAILKEIQRDEFTHVALFRNIIGELRKENPELFTKDIEEELRGMMRVAVEQEIAWGIYITDNQILGLNNEIIDKYIKYLSNERLQWVGLEPLYPEITQHPMKWIEQYENMNDIKTDFFENTVSNYKDASSLDWSDFE